MAVNKGDEKSAYLWPTGVGSGHPHIAAPVIIPRQPPRNLQQYRCEQASKISEAINLGFTLSEVPP